MAPDKKKPNSLRKEAPRRAGKDSHVAFAACRTGEGRLLRVGMSVDTDKRPTVARISDCPYCDSPHIAALIWRRAEERDNGKLPQVLLDEDGKQIR